MSSRQRLSKTVPRDVSCILYRIHLTSNPETIMVYGFLIQLTRLFHLTWWTFLYFFPIINKHLVLVLSLGCVLSLLARFTWLLDSSLDMTAGSMKRKQHDEGNLQIITFESLQKSWQSLSQQTSTKMKLVLPKIELQSSYHSKPIPELCFAVRNVTIRKSKHFAPTPKITLKSVLA